MAKLPCRKKCPENMQRQCRLEFGYAGMPPCAKLAVKKLTAHNTTNNAIALLIDLQEAICSNDIADPSVHDMLMKRINAVIAQQH